MSKEVRLRIVEAVVAVVGMVFIWRLVEASLYAGVDSWRFFVGVAAIAGLGGYELRWVIDALVSKARKGN